MGRMMNLLELGGLLKEEREKRGLSLRDVMEATKISRRNLNALEGGEVDQLPHPVYLKGYVRNYAKLVELDPEPLVEVVEAQTDGPGYLPQVPSSGAPRPAEPVEASAPSLSEAPAASFGPDLGDAAGPEPTAPTEAQPAVSSASEPVGTSGLEQDASASATPEPVVPATPPESESSATTAPEPAASAVRAPSPRPLGAGGKNGRVWPWVLLVAAVLIGVLAYMQYRRISREMEAPASVNATAAASAAAPANATAAPAPLPASPDANASASAENAPAPVSAAGVAPAGDQPAGQVGQAGQAGQIGDQSAAQVSGSSLEVSRKAGAGQADPAGQSGASGQAATPGMQRLVVTAKPNDACWVDVSEGGRHKTFTLKNGESRSFDFSKKAKLRLGNAGGVTLQVNGAPYPYDGQRGATATLEIGAK